MLLHLVFIPKCQRKALCAQHRRYLGEVLQQLARQKESGIEEGRWMSGHVSMMIATPPQCAVARAIGSIEGMRGFHVAWVYGERERNFVGRHFLAGGSFVPTAGRGETILLDDIRRQEKEDEPLEHA